MEAAELAFMRRIAELEGRGMHASRRHMPGATREQDRIRQRLKRDGLVTWETRPKGHWALTDAGRKVINTEQRT